MDGKRKPPRAQVSKFDPTGILDAQTFGYDLHHCTCYKLHANVNKRGIGDGHDKCVVFQNSADWNKECHATIIVSPKCWRLYSREKGAV